MKMINSLIVVSTLALFSSAGLAQTATTVPTVEPRTYGTELVTNAASHSSLSENQSSGHDDRGFFLSNGPTRLNIGGDFQFRYTYNNNQSLDNNNIGFNIPLARLRFSGNLNESFDYMMEADFNSSNGSASLKDAYAGWKAFEHGRIQFGQFKLPFMREVNVSDRFQLAADRSVESYVFGQGRSQGAQISYDIGGLRLTGAISDGFNSSNTQFTNAAESDLALTARADYVIMGSRSSFYEFTSERNQESSLMAGAAFHYQDGETQDNMYTFTGDVSWQSHGWNAFVSGVGRSVENTQGTFDDFGGAIQGGYRVTENLEPFARYDIVHADSDWGFANNNFNFVTAGMNYYVYGQAAKFTLDAVWSLDETTGLNSMSNFSNTGLLGSMEANEVALRAQFQLLF